MKKRLYPAFIVHICLIILEAIGVYLSAKADGWGLFIYFTENANILSLAVSLLFVIYAFGGRKGEQMPHFMRVLRLISASSLLLVFLIVVFVLAPMEGKGAYRRLLLSDSMLYMHLLCPFLSIGSFLFLENEKRLPAPAALYAALPLFCYTLLAILMNLLKHWHGPYPFLLVYEQPVYLSLLYAFLIPAFASALGLLLLFLQKHIFRMKKRF